MSGNNSIENPYAVEAIICLYEYAKVCRERGKLLEACDLPHASTTATVVADTVEFVCWCLDSVLDENNEERQQAAIRAIREGIKSQVVEIENIKKNNS